MRISIKSIVACGCLGSVMLASAACSPRRIPPTSVTDLMEDRVMLDGVLTENRGALRGFMQQGLPQVEALVRDSREAAREFEQLAKSLRENPSQLLYQPVSSGVEIPR